MIGVVLVASILFAQAAPAATPASPPAPGAPQGAVSPVVVTGKKDTIDKGSQIVCRTEPVLGTLFPKKICVRQDELSQRTREDQQMTREATNLRPYKIDGGIPQ